MFDVSVVVGEKTGYTEGEGEGAFTAGWMLSGRREGRERTYKKEGRYLLHVPKKMRRSERRAAIAFAWSRHCRNLAFEVEILNLVRIPITR